MADGVRPLANSVAYRRRGKNMEVCKKKGQLAEWRGGGGAAMGGRWIRAAAGRNDGGDPASRRRINELR